MAEIRDTSGVSLRRLYGLYPSKRDLVAAWLTRRHAAWMAWFVGTIEARSDEGAEPVLAAFDALHVWAATPGYRGCAFLNTAAEVGEIDEVHRRIIAEHKRGLIDYLVGLARAGGYRRPDELGSTIGVLIDGAIVQSAALPSLDPIDAARRAAERILEVHR